MDRILEARDVYAGGITNREFVYRQQHLRSHQIPREFASLPPVQARIDQGRWLADCPNSYCTNAHMIDLDDPRFFCTACGNQAAGGEWLHVEFPPDRAAIERTLLRRPRPENRNWRTGESLSDLRRENREHGLGRIR